MSLDLNQLRAVASLDTISGYQTLLDEVVKLERDKAVTKLKLSLSRDEILSAALEFRVWDSVYETLKQTPKACVKQLQEEGDTIYG